MTERKIKTVADQLNDLAELRRRYEASFNREGSHPKKRSREGIHAHKAEIFRLNVVTELAYRPLRIDTLIDSCYPARLSRVTAQKYLDFMIRDGMIIKRAATVKIDAQGLAYQFPQEVYLYHLVGCCPCDTCRLAEL